MKKIFGLLLCLLLLLACATALADVEINDTNFTDQAFRELVSTFNTDGGGLSDDEISAVTTIDCNGKGISSLKGIEFFTALDTLYCRENNLKTLDLSGNPELTNLDCSDNSELSSLNVTQNTKLNMLFCGWCALTELDVSNNTNLKHFDCCFNQLTSLNLSNNTKLTILGCHGNDLTVLDLSSCPLFADEIKNYTRQAHRGEFVWDYWTNNQTGKEWSLTVPPQARVIAGDFTSNPIKALEFAEKERINYKPIIKESRPELTVDTWLQEMAFEDEEYFKELDPDGPVITVEQDDGNPKIETWIDEKKVLRLKTFLTSPVKIKLKLTAVWAGQTATTNVYVDFFNCDMPKTIGFNDEYTISIGDKVKLVTNYDDGKWPYRKWIGLYYESVSEEGIVRVWADEYPDKTGACSYFEGLKAGTVVIRFNANQDGLNWAKDVTVTVLDPNAPTEMTEQKLNLKIKDLKLTASGTKAIKVTWAKLSKKDQKKVGKFVIEISTDKKFKKDVITKTVSAKKNSVTIKKLKPGKKYYVRIRAIKEEGNIRYVTKWFKKNIALKK